MYTLPFPFQLKKQGVICRPSSNECDIPEYCTGESGICPRDVYKKNGNTCGQTRSALGDITGKHYFASIDDIMADLAGIL